MGAGGIDSPAPQARTGFRLDGWVAPTGTRAAKLTGCASVALTLTLCPVPGAREQSTSPSPSPSPCRGHHRMHNKLLLDRALALYGGL